MTNTDNVSPGPRRWERAVKAALAKPDTYHAKLLFERLNRVRHLFPRDDAYWVVRKHERNQYYCSDFCAGLASHLDAHVGRNCHWSSYDALIEEIARNNGEKITIGTTSSAWWSSKYYMERVYYADLPRTVKCFACGIKMTREGTDGYARVDFGPAIIKAADCQNSQVEENPQDRPLEDWERELLQSTPEPKYPVILAPNGETVVSPPQYRTVSLTERERVILGYVPAHFRHEVADRLERL